MPTKVIRIKIVGYNGDLVGDEYLIPTARDRKRNKKHRRGRVPRGRCPDWDDFEIIEEIIHDPPSEFDAE